MQTIATQAQLTQALKKEARKQGFEPVGIARIPGSKRLQARTQALEAWLNAGYQAEMNWMAAPRRKNAITLLEGVKSLLAVGLNYYVNQNQNPGTLSIARYGWGNDYHKVVEKRLKAIGKWLEIQRPSCKWKICVDAAPLLDKAWAEEAGLGWIGKHSNLINPSRGSWMVLGHLLCTEVLIPDKPSKSQCGICKACITACPTNAISEPYIVDSRKCIAYHTIENRCQKLPEEIESSLGSWVAGCDICQEVCPWNKKPIVNTNDPDLKPREWILNLTKNEALNWDDKKWREQLKGSALKRIKPWMWRRNAAAIKSESPSKLIKQKKRLCQKKKQS